MYLLPKLIFLIQKKKEVNFAEKIISNLPTTKKTISKCTKWYMPYLECCTMNFPHPCWVIGITTTSAICSKVIRSDTILVFWHNWSYKSYLIIFGSLYEIKWDASVSWNSLIFLVAFHPYLIQYDQRDIQNTVKI